MSQEKLVWLACEECKQKMHQVEFSQKKEKKLELNKFCRNCRKHTKQKQVK